MSLNVNVNRSWTYEPGVIITWRKFVWEDSHNALLMFNTFEIYMGLIEIV